MRPGNPIHFLRLQKGIDLTAGAAVAIDDGNAASLSPQGCHLAAAMRWSAGSGFLAALLGHLFLGGLDSHGRIAAIGVGTDGIGERLV